MPELTCRALATSAAVALSVTAVAGCTGSADDTGQRLASNGKHAVSSAASAPTPTPTTVEPGTTPPGTELHLGQAAVVRYTTDPAHDSLIKLTVDSIRRGRLTDLRQFRLSNTARRSGLFYVSATVTNTGTGDLGGQTLSLYGKVSHELSVPPFNLGTACPRCDDQPLPSPFVFGDRARVCLVFFAPRRGTVRAVQWSLGDDLRPITWHARH